MTTKKPAEKEKRTERIAVICTKAEKREILALADSASRSGSDYLRLLALSPAQLRK